MARFLDIFGKDTALITCTEAEPGREPLAEGKIEIPFHAAVEEGLIVFRKDGDTARAADKEIVPKGIDFILFLLCKRGGRGEEQGRCQNGALYVFQ